MKNFLLVLSLSIASAAAQDDAPIVHLGFENGFAYDGGTTGLTFNATAEQFGTNAFVPGVVGKGFHLSGGAKDLVIQGPIFHSTEGTFSFWGKPPDGWKTTEFNGPSFFRFFLPGQDCIFYRIYAALAVYESTGPQMTQMQDSFLEDGRWRMMTFVYKQGYRCLYVDDVPVFENKKAINDLAQWAKGEPYSKYLQTYGSPVYYDEITTWNKPFSAGEVAALFYSHTNALKGADSFVVVPKGAATELAVGYNGYTGGRIASDETVTLSHTDGILHATYRMPLPKDYVAEKTRLGGSFFKSTAKQRDDDVFVDDCVVVDLSPDGGVTHHRFAVNMGGVVYDAKNGDKTFDHPFEAKVLETEREVAVSFTIPLSNLGEAKDGRWSFNLTRMVQQAGLARHQVFYSCGAMDSYGTIQLAEQNGIGGRMVPRWDARARTLTVDVDCSVSDPLVVEARLEPLDHRTVFPDDKGVNLFRDKQPVFPALKESRTFTPTAGKVTGQLALTLEGGHIALATLVLKDSKGNILLRDSGLAPCTEAGTLQVKYIPSQRKLHTEVTLPSASVLSHNASATIEIRRRRESLPSDDRGNVAAGDGSRLGSRSHIDDNRVLAAKRIEPFHQLSEEISFDMAHYPLGDYEVEAAIRVDGKNSGSLTGTMTKQADPVWVGNHLGEIKEVPKPWTPMTVARDVVRLWGRTETFDRSFLPTGLTSLGQEMLAAPIRFTAEVNGKPGTLTARSLRLRRADKAGMKVDLSGSGTLGELSASLDGWIEFDGFHLTHIELKSPKSKPVTLNNVAIEIPLRKEMATLYDISGYEPIHIQAGAIPTNGVQSWAGSGQRVGTEERGIQWTINPDPSLLKTGSNTLFIIPQKDQVLLRLVLANQPIQVKGTQWFEFGLQALPFRPYPREMRDYFLGAFGLDVYSVARQDVKTVVGWRHPMASLYTEGWSGKWNYLHFNDKTLAGLRDATRNWFVQGNTFPALYLNIVLGDGNTPEYAYYQNEWSWDGTSAPNLVSPTKLIKDYPGHDGKHDYGMARVNIEAKSYREFYYYYLDQVLGAYQSISNAPPVWVYYDNSGLVSCNNPYAGNPPKQPGDLSMFLAYRDFLKHTWAIVHAHDPRNYVTIHNSGSRLGCAYSFCDVWIEGEQFTAWWSSAMSADPKLTQNDCYPTVLSLDKVRAMFNSHVWTQYVFLSQFWNDERQKEDEYRKTHPPRPDHPPRTPPSMEKRYRYLSGLMRVNDTPLWGELTPALPTYTRMIEWGWDDSIEFVPYWNPHGMFEFAPGEPDKVAVSAWVRPDGKLVMCVFNGQKQPVTVRIALHRDKFPVKMRSFTNATDMTSPDPVFEEDKTEPDVFPIENGSLRIPVRAEDYRMLRFDE